MAQNGSVTITAREKKSNYGAEECTFFMEFTDKPGKDERNIFIVILRKLGKDKYLPVYKTEVMPRSKNVYKFNKVKIDTDTLCDAEEEREILIKVFKHQPTGSHKIISEASTTL